MVRNTKLSTKMMLFGLTGILGFSLALGWVYFKIGNRIYESERSNLKTVTEVAFTLLTEYDARVKKGEFSLEEGQKRASLRIKNLRYKGQEYFWINDLSPKMIMHPFKPELDGKDLSENKDPMGKRLFIEMVNVCKASGAGYVEYMWPKQGESQPAPKLSYVKHFEPWGWIIGTGIYMDYLQKEMAQIRNVFLGVLIVLGLGGIIFSFWLSRSTAQPIVRAVEGIRSSADELKNVSSHMASASCHLGEGASEQAAAIEETSASLEEIASMTRKNAENAGQADRLMSDANSIVERGNKAMADLTNSMHEISTAGESTQKIVKTIDEIAFQTNLLALNAAVEAARAGEAGAGFAVVADEVRNLAMRAAEAARSTADLIENTVRRVHEGSKLVTRTAGEFSEVTAIVSKASDLISEIAAASNEQAEGIEHVNTAVSQMDKVVQENAAGAEETAAISERMAGQTEQVRMLLVDLSALVGINTGESGNGNKQKTVAQKARADYEYKSPTQASVQNIPPQQRDNNGKSANGKAKATNIHRSKAASLDELGFDDF